MTAECVLWRKRKIQRYDPSSNLNYESEYDLRTPPKNRKRQQEQLFYGNIMTDPRIWRGNTYTLYRNQKQEQKKNVELERDKRLMRARPVDHGDYHRRMRATRDAAIFDTVPPVAGRSHNVVQTELFLQEMLAKVPEAEQANQTDEFLERPPSPVFVPAKTGLDVDTQIYDGELFLFDVEVKPVLEVLNGKVIEQALLEVAQEEELAAIREQQRAFQTIKNFERAEQQRLVDEQRRLREEKETRKRERLVIMKKEQEVQEKLAAQAFAKTYLEALVPNVFHRLHADGMFLSPARAELDVHFLPWLMRSVSKSLDEETAINLVVRDLINESIMDNKSKADAVWRELLRSMIPVPPPPAAPTETSENPDEAQEPLRGSLGGPIPIPHIEPPQEED